MKVPWDLRQFDVMMLINIVTVAATTVPVFAAASRIQQLFGRFVLA